MKLGKNLHRAPGEVHRPSSNLVQEGKWWKTQSISESQRHFPRMVAGQRDGVREADGESPLAVGGMGRKEREESKEGGCGSGTVTEREMGALGPLKQPLTG